MIEIEILDAIDPSELGAAWHDLECRSDGSFFQSWAWVGCLAGERFPDPVLLRARDRGVPVVLGLCNRRRHHGRCDLLLNESGDPAYDAVFVEHNGFLIERDRPERLAADCLRALLRRSGRLPWPRRGLVLSGIPESYIPAATVGPSHVAVRATQPAPFVDLHALRQTGREYLAALSANTRYQLARSSRRYSELGPLALRRAGSVAEGLAFLDRLAELHQRYWTGRGEPGAFANPVFGRFHRALIERAFPAGGIDLLRVSAGEHVLGYLYNFRYRQTAYAYQSGFDYSLAGAQLKPGLTSHHLAIERYLQEGLDRYDFLAGASRYKQSLATGSTTLHWLDIAPGLDFRPWQKLARVVRSERRISAHPAVSNASAQ